MVTGPAHAGESKAAAPTPTFSKPVAGHAFHHRAPAFTVGGHPVDLDGDGRAEIVQTFSNIPAAGAPNRRESIMILRADPKTLAYSDATSKLISGTVPSLVLTRVFVDGDLNGDKRRDVFLGGHGYDQNPWPGEPDALLLSKSKGKHVTQVAPPGLATYTHAAAVGDIDGDGLDDVYVGIMCCNPSPGPYFLLGRKAATPEAVFDRLPPVVATRQSNYSSANLIDIQGSKGKALVLASHDEGDNVVYFNDGTGSFNKPTPDIVLPPGLYGSPGTITVHVFAADLDSDGHTDLILSQTASDPFYQGHGLQVLMSRNGQFVDQTKQTLLGGSGFNPKGDVKFRIFAADFFGDGIVDFVVQDNGVAGRTLTGCSHGGPLVFLNDGSGVFTSYTRALFDPHPANSCNFLYAIDVNRDGRSDLVAVGLVNDSKDIAYTYLNAGLKGSAKVAPKIVRQPEPVTVNAGDPMLLSVAAHGPRPLKFQWYRNGKAVPHATKPVLSIAHANKNQRGKYRVKVSNGAGKATSVSVQAVVN